MLYRVSWRGYQEWLNHRPCLSVRHCRIFPDDQISCILAKNYFLKQHCRHNLTWTSINLKVILSIILAQMSWDIFYMFHLCVGSYWLWLYAMHRPIGITCLHPLKELTPSHVFGMWGKIDAPIGNLYGDREKRQILDRQHLASGLNPELWNSEGAAQAVAPQCHPSMSMN